MSQARRLCRLLGHVQHGRFPHPQPPATSVGSGKGADGRLTEGRKWEMSDEELYLFDAMGFLRVRNVLDQATVVQALESASRITKSGDFDHILMRDKGTMPGGNFFVNAFLYDKVIERISHCPRMMDYVCHVTNNQPRLTEQILMVQNAGASFNNFHLRKDNDVQWHEDAPRFHTDYAAKRIYLDHVSFFVYLTGAAALC